MKNARKAYTVPELEITRFSTEDVITASSLVMDQSVIGENDESIVINLGDADWQ